MKTPHLFLRLGALFITILIVCLFPSVFGMMQFYTTFVGALVLALAATMQPQRRETLLTLATWVPASFLLCGLTLLGICLITPHTIDKALDFGLSRQVWYWAQAHPVPDLFFRLIYSTVLLAISIGFCTTDNLAPLLKSLIICVLLAIPCYIIFPATAHIGSATLGLLATAFPACT
jgi:hypothetical protein